MYLHQYISNDIELFILAWMAIGTVGKKPKIDMRWVVNDAQSKHQTCELSTQIKFLCFLECWRILFEHQKEYLIKLKFWCLEKKIHKILHTILNRILCDPLIPIPSRDCDTGTFHNPPKTPLWNQIEDNLF